MKKPYWTHPKYKTKFTGSYHRVTLYEHFAIKQTERVFVLTNGKRTISFESHQAAKKQAWRLEK